MITTRARPQMLSRMVALLGAAVLTGGMVMVAPAVARATFVVPTAGCYALSDNLVANCGFETTDFTSWTQGGNTTDTTVGEGFGYDHTYGLRAGPVETPGTLSQTLSTGAGSYTLGFWLYDSSTDYFAEHTFSVSVSDSGGTTALASWAHHDNYWTFHQYVFTTTGSPTVTFAFRNDPSYWFLDDVSVVANVAPTVTTDPSPQTVYAGETATFTAAATGSPAPAVVWQQSTDGGTSWSDLSDNTDLTLLLTTSIGQNGNRYRAHFTSTAGTANSSGALLTVNASTAPVVTQDPVSQSGASGATVSLTAAATGTPTPTLLWQTSVDSGTTWSGTGMSESPLSVRLDYSMNGRQYRALFTNVAGSTATSAATLTVTPIAPAVSVPPNSQTVASGSTASFFAAATGDPVPTMQWQVSTNGGTTWADVTGATGMTYSFSAYYSDNGKTFRAVFTNAGGTVPSTGATLTVTATKPVFTSALSATVSKGLVTVHFVVYADPSPSTECLFDARGSAWTACADGDSFKTHAKRVQIRATNAGGTTTSSWVTITKR